MKLRLYWAQCPNMHAGLFLTATNVKNPISQRYRQAMTKNNVIRRDFTARLRKAS